jgi:hypothetical protein
VRAAAEDYFRRPFREDEPSGYGARGPPVHDETGHELVLRVEEPPPRHEGPEPRPQVVVVLTRSYELGSRTIGTRSVDILVGS